MYQNASPRPPCPLPARPAPCIRNAISTIHSLFRIPLVEKIDPCATGSGGESRKKSGLVAIRVLPSANPNARPSEMTINPQNYALTLDPRRQSPIYGGHFRKVHGSSVLAEVAKAGGSSEGRLRTACRKTGRRRKLAAIMQLRQPLRRASEATMVGYVAAYLAEMYRAVRRISIKFVVEVVA